MTTPTHPQAQPAEKNSKRPWRRPEVRTVGTLGAILKGGSNKITQETADTFDSVKGLNEA